MDRKVNILKEFNSGLPILTCVLHAAFVAVRTLDCLDCLAAVLFTGTCRSTVCAVALHSHCAVAQAVGRHPLTALHGFSPSPAHMGL